MSWFAGIFNIHKLSGASDSRDLSIEHEFFYKDNKLLLWSDRTNTNITQKEHELKLLCGVVLQKKDKNWKLVEPSYLSEQDCFLSIGHYIGLDYSQDEITFYNDKFGLRELYYYHDEISGDFYFSTRVDLLMEWKDKKEINWEEFGSYWLNRDPLGPGYFIKDIKRLNQSGRLTISKNNINKTNLQWTAEPEERFSNINMQEVIDNIADIVLAPVNSQKEIELALSGGYDSRSLLAILSHNGRNIEAVTWGKEDYPDVIVAKALASLTDINHKYFYIDNMIEDSWDKFSKYSGRNQLVVQGTAAFELHYYHELNKNKVLIDGGCGELIRRCINANLEYLGKKAILNKNSEQILKYMVKVKADIFKEELLHSMKQGLNQRAEEAVRAMPDARKIGIGNWIETWDVRQRISNISSRSQQTLDDIISNYMPYVQAPVIESAMKIPSKIRAGNKILAEVLRQYNPEMKRVPTIRNGMRMKYGISRVEGKLRAVILRRNSYVNNTNSRFLYLHKERITDLVNDCERFSDIYDIDKIRNMVRRFYKNGSSENEMIWWLSFETYRHQFGIRK